MSGSKNGTCGDREHETTIEDGGKNAPLPDYDGLRTAIARLKNNKMARADGLSAELFKYYRANLTRRMQQILCRIWLQLERKSAVPTKKYVSIRHNKKKYFISLFDLKFLLLYFYILYKFSKYFQYFSVIYFVCFFFYLILLCLFNFFYKFSIFLVNNFFVKLFF